MPRGIGLSAALALPLTCDGSIELDRLGEHAAWVLDNGCQSVTVFGTTGEGASLGDDDRRDVLAALTAKGIETRKSVIGAISATAVGEAVAQAQILYDADCRAILLPPPFLYKRVTQEGVFDWYAAVLSTLGRRARDVILYHIPDLTAVPISVSLITRLKHAFPDAIMGVKDSSGDFDNTRALIETHKDLAILVGDERYLAQSVKLGGGGSVSGIANIRPDVLRHIIGEGADHSGLTTVVDEVLRHPVVPALKTLIAHSTGTASWRNVRPPLRPLHDQEVARLTTIFDAALPAGS